MKQNKSFAVILPVRKPPYCRGFTGSDALAMMILDKTKCFAPVNPGIIDGREVTVFGNTEPLFSMQKNVRASALVGDYYQWSGEPRFEIYGPAIILMGDDESAMPYSAGFDFESAAAILDRLDAMPFVRIMMKGA